MNGANIIAVIILAAIVIAVLAYLLHWLYRHSTKDVSFVRTGFLGEKIVMGGGALVLPIVHDLTEVNMNTLRLEVLRKREKSLITKDRMRIELEVEFYVRVVPNIEAVATAARTLGSRTMNPESLRDLIQGRFVDAMGAVAASMDMEAIHEKRSEFIKHIREEVADSLTLNGLELETVSLTTLDQADISLFNPSNAFDAEGLTRLTEEIEMRKKKRNDIEQDTMIAVRKKNLEAEKIALDIARESEYAKMAEDSEVAIRRAQQKAEVELINAAKEREVEIARLKEREEVEKSRIQMEQSLEAIEIKRQEALAIEQQQREIAISQKSKERSLAQSEAEKARAKMLEETEKAQTARDTEIANRKKQIELIAAAQEAERVAVGITLNAQAEKAAAKDLADADGIAVKALQERLAVEAEGKRALNEAENLRTDASRKSALHQRLVESLPDIIRESVKPMENIDEIKILHVEGLPGLSGNGSDSEAGGEVTGAPTGGNLADQVVNSALRYRSQAPFVDTLLGEIGMSGENVHRMEGLQDLSKIVYTEPGAPDDTAPEPDKTDSKAKK
ncbi:MAG: flotillin domain-containing protein [Roseovarius sp.]|nr:flotillin domain-containing protein [Roseovarius sp.]